LNWVSFSRVKRQQVYSHREKKYLRCCKVHLDSLQTFLRERGDVRIFVLESSRDDEAGVERVGAIETTGGESSLTTIGVLFRRYHPTGKDFHSESDNVQVKFHNFFLKILDCLAM